MANSARKGATDSEVMSAAWGSIIVNDTSEKVFDCDLVVSLSDLTVIDRIEINGATGANVVSTYVTTIGNVVPKGGVISGIGADYISAITLGAGAVNLEAKKP